MMIDPALTTKQGKRFWQLAEDYAREECGRSANEVSAKYGGDTTTSRRERRRALWERESEIVARTKRRLREARRRRPDLYGGIILMAILMACISFIVQKILRRFWPD